MPGKVIQSKVHDTQSYTVLIAPHEMWGGRMTSYMAVPTKKTF